MTESLQNREVLKKEMLDLATRLSKEAEPIPFPGIKPEAYSKIKEGEAQESEYPDQSISIDELIKKLTEEGMKIILGPAKSGSVFAMSFNDSLNTIDIIFPRDLQTTDVKNKDLVRLIELQSELK